MKKNLSVFLLLFFIVSCTTTQEFVVRRNVPTNPTFVVIPANNLLYQVEFANKIESSLLETGVSVHQRPSLKEVRKKQSVGKTEKKESESRNSEEATLVEAYTAYDGLNADYLITTYAGSEQVRIIKRETNEVLASFKILNTAPPGEKLTSTYESIKNALKSMGVATK